MSMCVCFFLSPFILFCLSVLSSSFFFIFFWMLNVQCPMLFLTKATVCAPLFALFPRCFQYSICFFQVDKNANEKKQQNSSTQHNNEKKKRFHSNTSCIWPIGPYFCMCVSFFSSFLIIIIQPFSITTHSIVYTVVHCSRPWWSQALKLTTLSALTHYYYYHQSRSFLFFGSVVCPYALAHFEIVYTLYEGDRIVVAIGQSD